MPNDILLFVNMTQMLTPPSEMTSSKCIVDHVEGEGYHVFPASKEAPCSGAVLYRKENISLPELCDKTEN